MAAKDEERERRLAAALRENLRRRKAQARASAPTGEGEPAMTLVDPDSPGSNETS